MTKGAGLSPIAVMVQALRSKPASPPCRALAPSLVGNWKRLAVELERTVGDPVGVAPDGRAKETPQRDITVEIIAAEDDIGETALRDPARRSTESTAP